jgi:prepilin-type N-terminal cleavage/methylation domain-containing protein
MKKTLPPRRQASRDKGFSLIEVLIGIALVGIGLIGLVPLFSLSVMINLRANQLGSATFLCQQQIDNLRSLTPAELNVLPVVQDEQIDINGDGTVDFRRITNIQRNIDFYKVYVFPPSQLLPSASELIADPEQHFIKGQMGTIIKR